MKNYLHELNFLFLLILVLQPALYLVFERQVLRLLLFVAVLCALLLVPINNSDNRNYLEAVDKQLVPSARCPFRLLVLLYCSEMHALSLAGNSRIGRDLTTGPSTTSPMAAGFSG